MYILSRDEGGRQTPFLSYCLHLYFRTTDINWVPSNPAGRRRDGNAGRQHQNGCYPDHPIAMDDGWRFAIREGGRTVGAGVVAEVLG
ncbi:hypothetical protein ACLB1M_26360 [Escherichia coli]